VHRLCGARAKEENQLLAPIRSRHLRDAREKAARHERNIAVLSRKPLTIEERGAAAALRDEQRNLTPDEIEAVISHATNPDADPEISSEEISSLFATEPQLEKQNEW
jgi:hypothetical protein